MNLKRTVVAVLVSASILGVVSLMSVKGNSAAVASPDAGLRTIQVADKSISVTVVDTPELRARGLGGRYGLAQDEGMLFVFASDAKYQFWMKDMRFPIDILWISGDEKVVDARENVSPETYPEVYAPNVPSRYVLELPAGFMKRNSVSVGDLVEL